MNYKLKDIYEALDILGLSVDYTAEQLKKNHHALILKWHPDTNKDPKALSISQNINRAKIILEKELKAEKIHINEKDIKDYYIKEGTSLSKDIEKVERKYFNDTNIINLCHSYYLKMDDLENSDLNISLKLRKIKEIRKEFDYKLKKLKLENELRNRKLEFVKRIKSNKEDVLKECIEISSKYRNLLDNINSLNELSELISKYEIEISEAKELARIKKYEKEVKEAKERFITKINDLKNKYPSDKVKELINNYIEKLDFIKDLESLTKLQNDFMEELYNIRKHEEDILSLKKSLLKKLTNYENKDLKLKFTLVKYMDLVNAINDLNELQKLEIEIIELINKIDKEKNKERKKVVNDKKNYIKITIYKFYEASKNLSIDNILKAKDMLIKVINIINSMEFSDIENIGRLIDKIKYTNLDFENSNIDLLMLLNKENVLNKNSISDYLNNLDSSFEFDLEDNYMSSLKREFVDKLMEKFKMLSVSLDTNGIFELLNNLETVLKEVNSMEENDFYNNLLNLKKIDLSNKENVKNILKEVGIGSKVFIKNSTGQLYYFSGLSDNILLIPVDESLGIELYSEKDFNLKFISINDFFDSAKYVGFNEIVTRIDRKNNERYYSPIEEKNLFINGRLLLKYNENTNEYYFASSPSIFGFKIIDYDYSKDYNKLKEKYYYKFIDDLKQKINIQKENSKNY